MQIIRALVYSNLWIALSVSAFIVTTFFIREVDVNWWMTLFVFSATLFTYNFQRLVRLPSSKNSGEHILWVRQFLKLVYAITIIGGISMVVAMTHLSQTQFLWLTGLGIISVLYAYPFLSNKRGLRDLPHIKIHLIAFTWASTAILPYIAEHAPFQSIPEWVWVEKYLFILAITIPFDIRDLPYDDPAKRTIPQLLGVSGAKVMALLALGGHVAIAFLIYGSSAAYGLAALAGLTCLLILMSGEKRHTLYYTGLLDALPILQCVAVWLLVSR